MTTTEFDNYAEMLTALRDLAVKAAGVEGASDVGAFYPIPTGRGPVRGPGEFSDLSEFLDNFADALQDFLSDEGDEVETWDAA